MRYHGLDLYTENIDAVEVRRRIGMVFQNPIRFQSRYTTMLHLALASVASRSRTWTAWSRSRCDERRCGMRLKTG